MLVRNDTTAIVNVIASRKAAKQSPIEESASASKGETMKQKHYCVYIMTNTHHTVLYTGVTNNLQHRVLEHRAGNGGFTKKYNVTKLVFFECGNDVRVAIAREKQIKGGSRQKKIALVTSMNPDWKDLFE